MARLLGLDALQWTMLVVALLALLVMAEAWLGHYRSGFPLRAQYAPIAIGSFLIAAVVAALVAPGAAWSRSALHVAGATAVVTGIVGVGYHHWFGIVKKAGGYRWLLHHLMYSAPQLAPLSLSLLGAIALLAGEGASGRDVIFGVALWRLLLIVVAVGLSGAIIQVALLHYRGAFNSPLMWVPLAIPPLAVLAIVWMAAAPSPGLEAASRALLLLGVLTGVLGLGMHLRGLDRQMGGLFLFRFNILQGPPPFAPLHFAGLSAVGLAALELGR